MTYIINVQAGIEVLTFEVKAIDKQTAQIRAKHEASIITGSNYLKVLSVKAK